MDRTYPVTPEVLGLGWPQLLRMALLLGMIYLFFHRNSPVNFGSIVSEVFTIGTVLFIDRTSAPTRLRVTSDSIATVNGWGTRKVIRIDEVKRVKEINRVGRSGIEIVGRRDKGSLSPSRIFVPSALPHYEEIKQTVLCWEAAQVPNH